MYENTSTITVNLRHVYINKTNDTFLNHSYFAHHVVFEMVVVVVVAVFFPDFNIFVVLVRNLGI